ncbi:XRE family transcriptional regulator [Paraburkholderia hospita]|uniref:XRE family transcriptional regulator n=1 Tax=Paraburkholderia hospita TaxID=169430 RepID=UPI003ECE89B1
MKQGRFLSRDQVAACNTFRDAVLLAWNNRSKRGMTKSMLAAELDIKMPNLSNMLNPQAVDRHGKPRQDLPARYIAAFENFVGNKAITQYLTRMAMLTLMEEVIQRQETL